MKPLILIAGATAYVGGELLKSLSAAGYLVRCLARHPDVLRAKRLSGLEVVAGDVLDALRPKDKATAERMPTFLKSIVVKATVETVFGFHEREDALRLLSPRFPPLRVIRKTGGLEPGSRVELKIGPFLWTALHTAYEKDRLFADEQVQGPFAKWVHRHEFETVGDATRLTDRIEYRLPGGVWVNRLFGWAVQLGLRKMFRHRHQITKRFCEKGRLN